MDTDTDEDEEPAYPPSYGDENPLAGDGDDAGVEDVDVEPTSFQAAWGVEVEKRVVKEEKGVQTLEGRTLAGARGQVGGTILSAAGTVVLPIVKAQFAKEENLLKHCVEYSRDLVETWISEAPPDGWTLPV